VVAVVDGAVVLGATVVVTAALVLGVDESAGAVVASSLDEHAASIVNANNKTNRRRASMLMVSISSELPGAGSGKRPWAAPAIGHRDVVRTDG
jgi:hypothetical protein